MASSVLASFPYRCVAPAYGATGFLIASRLRLTGCRVETVWWHGYRTPDMVQSTLWTPGGPVALRLVHTLAPLPAYWREWKMALAAVDRSVRANGSSRMLMIGDFNATWGNSGFAALLHDGLIDGAAVGQGSRYDMAGRRDRTALSSHRSCADWRGLGCHPDRHPARVRQRSPLSDRHRRRPHLSLVLLRDSWASPQLRIASGPPKAGFARTSDDIANTSTCHSD